MSSLFDFDKPALYAVMGNPVAHSKSPRIHGLFAAATGQRLHYSAIQVDPGGFEQAVSNFIAHGGKGLNVTVPFKGTAWALAKRRSLRGALAACRLDELQGRHFDFVSNATAASLHGELPPLPATLLRADAWCYDMMYGAAPTPFMQWARSHGAATVLDGLGMLVEQAAEAFYLWRGVRPATAPVISTLRAELAGG